MPEITEHKRDSKVAFLSEFCCCSHDAKLHDFIEVTKWVNGIGYDVRISTKNGSQIFEITAGQIDALNAIIKEFK
jgi:hypothetical protein